MAGQVDYNTRPIDPGFLQKLGEYPVTGEHNGHKVRAEGKHRITGDGVSPNPIANGIHGTEVVVDWDTCIADGVCLDVCPVALFEWAFNPGQMGTGKYRAMMQGSEEWNRYRTDK